MHDGPAWQPLKDELQRWRGSDRVAALWLRDDDAIEPSAPLDRLLATAGRYAAPATLAVIPAGATQALADRLAGEAPVTVAVHGWAHANHAGPAGKKQELGSQRPLSVVRAELAKGKLAIDRLFGVKALPLLVPPWNRIDAGLLPGLADLGFAALSAFGRARAGPIRVVNTHVDLMDWHAGRKGKDHDMLVSEFVAELRSRRESGSAEPIGVLTHHLVHDEGAWSFLERLFEATAAHPGCRWAGARTLI